MSKKSKPKKGNLGESPLKATVCSFCEHSYIFPCNGERYECANAVWKRSKGRIDVGRLTSEQRAELAKTGKLPNVVTNPEKHVTALVQDVATGKREVKRVKLHGTVTGRFPAKDPAESNPPKKGKKKRIRL